MSEAVASPASRVLTCTRCGVPTEVRDVGPGSPFTDPDLFHCLPACDGAAQLDLWLTDRVRHEVRTVSSDPSQNLIPY